jgi:hypothetical protein
MMLGILGTIADYDEARAVVKQIMAALPAGSYLVINDSVRSPRADVAMQAARAKGADYYHLRTPELITTLFDGLDLVAPGVVSTPRWRPDDGEEPAALDVYCGMARKARR